MNDASVADIVFEVINNRRSVRRFTDQEVLPETVRTILDAARLAPSGDNIQPARFIVIRGQAIKDALASLGRRASIRRFRGEVITKRLEQRFASLKDETKKQELMNHLLSGEATAFVANAPVIIVVVGKKGGNVMNLPIDCSAAIENMLLMATALGLGTCWVTGINLDIREEQEVAKILAIPQDYKVISMIPLGYPVRIPKPRPRIPLEEMVYSEKYGETISF